MRIRCAFLCLCVGWAMASRGEDLTTLTGLTYTNIAVQRYDWEGIFIKHSGGISKIYFNEIQADQREHYKQMVPAPVAEEKPAPAPPADLGPGDIVTRSGQVYRHAAIRQTQPDVVAIHHSGGVAQVPFADLPEDLRKQLRHPSRIAPSVPLGSNDLATADGQVFRNVQVRKIEPDGLTIQHDAGLIKLPFPVLPEDWQKKYEYDPQKAEAYQRATAAAKEQADRDQQAIREQNAAAHAKQVKAEPIRVFEVSASKTGADEYRVRFSVRNYDDKPRTITATIGMLGSKEFAIPANSSQSGLEVTIMYEQPKYLRVRSGSYSTSQVLDW